MKIIYCTIYLLVIILASCKKSPKNEDLPPLDFPISKLALDYIQLKSGSYYIYKDSATGVMDSVFVALSILERKFQPAPAAPNRGEIIIFNRSFNYEVFSLTLMKALPPYTDWLKGSMNSNFNNPTYSGSGLIENNTSLTIFNLSDSQQSTLTITIEGRTYSSVIRTFSLIGTPGTDSYKASIYYWAKGYGVIKRTLISGATGYETTSLLVRNG